MSSSNHLDPTSSSTMINNRADCLTSGIIKLRKESSMTPTTLSPEDEDDLDDEDGDGQKEDDDWNKPKQQSTDPIPNMKGSRTGTVADSLTVTTTTSRVIKLFKKSPSNRSNDPIADRCIRFNINNNNNNDTTSSCRPGRLVGANATPVKSSPSSTIVTPNRGNNNHVDDGNSHRKHNHGREVEEDLDRRRPSSNNVSNYHSNLNHNSTHSSREYNYQSRSPKESNHRPSHSYRRTPTEDDNYDRDVQYRDHVSSRSKRSHEEYRRQEVEDDHSRINSKSSRSYKCYVEDRDDEFDRRTTDRPSEYVKSHPSRLPPPYDHKYERSHQNNTSNSLGRTPSLSKGDSTKEIGYVRSWADWDEHLSSNNKTYYWNRVTGKSQWDKPEEVLELESRSSSSKYLKEDERRNNNHHRVGLSVVKSGGKRREEYLEDDLEREDKQRRYDSRYETPRNESRKQPPTSSLYISSSSNERHRRSPEKQSSQQSTTSLSNNDYRRHHSRSRSNNHESRNNNYDRGDEKTMSKSCNNHKNNSKDTVQKKSNNRTLSRSLADSASISTPSDTDSKSDDLENDRDRIVVPRHLLTEDTRSTPYSNRRRATPSKGSVPRKDEGDVVDHGRKVRSEDQNNSLKENGPRTPVREQVSGRKRSPERSLTPVIETICFKKRARTSSDASDEVQVIAVKIKSPPLVIPEKRAQNCFDNISLSPSQVSMSNLKEIIESFSSTPEFSAMSTSLKKLPEEVALQTLHQMLRLLKNSSSGHLQNHQHLVSKHDVNKDSPVKTPLTLNSVHSNSKSRQSSHKSSSRAVNRSVYDTLKSNDIKDDLNRLLPRQVSSPASESSSSSIRSPRSDLHRGHSSRGLLSTATLSTSAVVPSAKSAVLSSQTVPSLTPSLAACFKEELIAHVQGWPAEVSERQAKKYAEEAHNLGSLNCTRVSAELKMARSLVRLTEIQATLQEQRILFVRQQIKDVQEWKGNQINANVSPATVSGAPHHPSSSSSNCGVPAEERPVNGPKSASTSTTNHLSC